MLYQPNKQSSQLRSDEAFVCLPLSRVRERGLGGEGLHRQLTGAVPHCRLGGEGHTPGAAS